MSVRVGIGVVIVILFGSVASLGGSLNNIINNWEATIFSHLHNMRIKKFLLPNLKIKQ